MKKKQKPLSFSLCEENIAYVEQQYPVRHRNKSHWMDDLLTHLRTKAKPTTANIATVEKPKRKGVAFDELDCNNFPKDLNADAWQEWITFRRKAGFKKYKTDASMKKLATMGNHEQQLLIVKQSIDNQYQGLFALKGGIKPASNILEDSAKSDWHLKDQGF